MELGKEREKTLQSGPIHTDESEGGERAMNSFTKALLSLQSFEFPPNGKAQRVRNSRKAVSTVLRLRSHLPVQILREYDYRKHHFGANCVVPVENEICSGCRVVLSQRTLRTSYHRLTECEHCGRLVYNRSRPRRIRLEVCAA